MKVIAAQAGQGCPVARAELTRMVEAKKEKEAAKAAVLKMSSKELKEKAAEGCPYAKKRLIGKKETLFPSTNPFRIEEKSRGKEARRSKKQAEGKEKQQEATKRSPRSSRRAPKSRFVGLVDRI